MPSLMRFLTIVAVLVAAGYASMQALASLVTPRTREMTVTIPSQRLRPPPAQAAAERNPQTAGAETSNGASATR